MTLEEQENDENQTQGIAKPVGVDTELLPAEAEGGQDNSPDGEVIGEATDNMTTEENSEIEQIVEPVLEMKPVKETAKETEVAEETLQVKDMEASLDEPVEVQKTEATIELADQDDANEVALDVEAKVEEEVEAGEQVTMEEGLDMVVATKEVVQVSMTEEVVAEATEVPAKASAEEVAEEKAAAHLEDILAEDLHALSKEELLAKLEGLFEQDVKFNNESAVRKVAEVFDHIVKEEEKLALAAYLEDGSVADDFKYKHPPIDSKFRALMNAHRDKRKAFMQDMEVTKEINMKKKLHVIDQLKKLLAQPEAGQTEDLSKGDISELRKLQDEWRSIGAVPQGKGEELYNEYNFQIDKFFNQRSRYFELLELDRKKNGETKRGILARAEKLIEETLVFKALQAYHKLFDEFKHTGPTNKEENDRLWIEMRAVSAKLVEKKKEIDEKLKEEAERIGTAKAEVIEKLKGIAASQLEKITDWTARGKEVAELTATFKETGGAFRDKHADISRQFWSMVKAFYTAKDAFFKEYDKERQANYVARQELLKKLQALDPAENKDSAEDLKVILADWKACGPVAGKHRDAINKKFSQALDVFFDKKNAGRKQINEVEAKNLAEKEALVAKLTEWTAAKSATEEEIIFIQKEFDGIGFVPIKQKVAIGDSFRAALQKAIDGSEKMNAGDKNALKLRILKRFANQGPRQDGDSRGGERGDYRNDNRGGDRRRDGDRDFARPTNNMDGRIRRLQTDVDTFKTNLDFFAKSKNSDKIKTEYLSKIAQAEEEIKLLREQMKQISA